MKGESLEREIEGEWKKQKKKHRELEDQIIKMPAEHSEQFIRKTDKEDIYGIEWKKINFYGCKWFCLL